MSHKNISPDESNIAVFPGIKAAEHSTGNKASFGDVIRDNRLKRGLSQLQLAEKIGVTKNAVGNWEAQRTRPDFSCVPALCNILGISIGQLFGQPESDHDLSMDDQRLLTNYHYLSKDSRKIVDTMIFQLLDAQERRLHDYCLSGFEQKLFNENRPAAGTGNPLSDRCSGQYIYLRKSREVCLADEVVTVSGDSMEPTFHNGDNLLIEHTECLAPGEIGVFVADGDGYVKEYQKDGLHSHNPAYPVLHFGEDDNVHCMGRVLGVVTPDLYATEEEWIALEDIRQEKASKRRN